MTKEELIGKLQMVYVGDMNALNEMIGYYDGLKESIEYLKQENKVLRNNYQTAMKVLADTDPKLKEYLEREGKL